MSPIQLPVSIDELRDARLRGILDVAGACIEAVPVWAWPLLILIVAWNVRRICVWLIRRWVLDRLGYGAFPRV